MPTAILIIDMLNDFFPDGRLMERRKELCGKINDLICCGREHNLKLIWIRQEFKEDLSDAFLNCVESYDEEHQNISLRYLGKEMPRLLDNPRIMKENFA